MNLWKFKLKRLIIRKLKSLKTKFWKRKGFKKIYVNTTNGQFSKSAQIFDCIRFLNEYDILELRLETLWDYVDYFVITESSLTHSGKRKELNFHNNRGRFKKYLSKRIKFN